MITYSAIHYNTHQQRHEEMLGAHVMVENSWRGPHRAPSCSPPLYNFVSDALWIICHILSHILCTVCTHSWSEISRIIWISLYGSYQSARTPWRLFWHYTLVLFTLSIFCMNILKLFNHKKASPIKAFWSKCLALFLHALWYFIIIIQKDSTYCKFHIINTFRKIYNLFFFFYSFFYTQKLAKS